MSAGSVEQDGRAGKGCLRASLLLDPSRQIVHCSDTPKMGGLADIRALGLIPKPSRCRRSAIGDFARWRSAGPPSAHQQGLVPAPVAWWRHGADVSFCSALHDADRTATTITDIYVTFDILVAIVMPNQRRWRLLAEQLEPARRGTYDFDDRIAVELVTASQRARQGFDDWPVSINGVAC